MGGGCYIKSVDLRIFKSTSFTYIDIRNVGYARCSQEFLISRYYCILDYGLQYAHLYFLCAEH